MHRRASLYFGDRCTPAERLHEGEITYAMCMTIDSIQRPLLQAFNTLCDFLIALRICCFERKLGGEVGYPGR